MANKELTVYGIDVFDPCGQIITFISNVFYCRQRADELIDMCNSLNLSLIHLMDVIYDFIE